MGLTKEVLPPRPHMDDCILATERHLRLRITIAVLVVAAALIRMLGACA